jgi:lipoprotein-anchoring transpeptidase ErfK/SrfK
MRFLHYVAAALSAAAVSIASGAAALAQPFAMTSPGHYAAPIFREVMPQPDITEPEDGRVTVPAHLRRQTVNYQTREAPGTIVIDTPNTYLYFVLGGGRAIRYGIGVGRDGFTWSGTRSIDRKQEWPDWHPPAEMIARQPYLPRFMAGGPGNPLGARAMYLGGTLYRIHGTNQPSSIGQRVSSGCIRMLNEDAIDLFNRAPLGTRVVVLPDTHRRAPANVASAPQPQAAPPAVTVYDDPPRPMASVPVFPGRPLDLSFGGSRLY